jgi:hypothetical protein
MLRRSHLGIACHSSYLIVVGSLILAGCSGPEGDANRRPTAPTSGVVMYQGKPVADATVSFLAISGDPISAFGLTDAQGKFTMRTYEDGDGAPVGEHQVTITKTEAGKQPPGPPRTGPDEFDPNKYDPPGFGVTPPPVVKHLIPEKYASSATSGLKATVTADKPNEFTFDLK